MGREKEAAWRWFQSVHVALVDWCWFPNYKVFVLLRASSNLFDGSLFSIVWNSAPARRWRWTLELFGFEFRWGLIPQQRTEQEVDGGA